MRFTLTPCRRLALTLAVGLMLSACAPGSPEAHLASARQALATGNMPAVVIEARNALSLDARSAEARLLLGRGLLATASPSGAETELRKALDLGQPPESVWPHLLRALALQGQFKRLVDEFASASPADPALRADLKAGLGSAYMFLGRPDDAAVAPVRSYAAPPEKGSSPRQQHKQQNDNRASHSHKINAERPEPRPPRSVPAPFP